MKLMRLRVWYGASTLANSLCRNGVNREPFLYKPLSLGIAGLSHGTTASQDRPMRIAIGGRDLQRVELVTSRWMGRLPGFRSILHQRKGFQDTLWPVAITVVGVPPGGFTVIHGSNRLSQFLGFLTIGL